MKLAAALLLALALGGCSNHPLAPHGDSDGPIHCYRWSSVDGQRDEYNRPIPFNDWHYVCTVERRSEIPPGCVELPNER